MILQKVNFKKKFNQFLGTSSTFGGKSVYTHFENKLGSLK